MEFGCFYLPHFGIGNIKQKNVCLGLSVVSGLPESQNVGNWFECLYLDCIMSKKRVSYFYDEEVGNFHYGKLD